MDCVHITFFLVSIETTNDWFEKENIILIGNKKIIRTQSALPVGLCVLSIKFGLCSYYFFLVSIETTNDWLEKENMILIRNKKNN